MRSLEPLNSGMLGYCIESSNVGWRVGVEVEGMLRNRSRGEHIARERGGSCSRLTASLARGVAGASWRTHSLLRSIALVAIVVIAALLLLGPQIATSVQNTSNNL